MKNSMEKLNTVDSKTFRTIKKIMFGYKNSAAITDFFKLHANHFKLMYK